MICIFKRQFLLISTSNSNMFCTKVQGRFLSSLPSSFKPVNLQDVRTEFRAYGNGKIDFETRDNKIGIIKLNYPEKKNAISGRMMSDFYDLMISLESRQDLKGLILTGEGDFFCAGGDLTTIMTHLNSQEMGWKMTNLMHETMNKFYTLPFVSVAIIHGRALGGGAELALAPDLRVFAEKSGKLNFVQARMGLIPGWGGATRLKNLTGSRSKTLEILLSCRKIDSKEALSLGLCDKVIPDDKDLLEESINWLEKLTIHDSTVISAIKKSVTKVDLDDLENERKLFAPLWNGPANREALMNNIKH